MRNENLTQHDPRIQRALEELKATIQRYYPAATFVVAEGDDSEGIYLKSIVDIEYSEEAFDTVIERLLELQIDEELPTCVIPLRPIESVARLLREQAATKAD